MRRLLLTLGLLFLGGELWATCTPRCQVKAACTTTAPCNTASASTWYDDSVGEGTPCPGAGGLPDATTRIYVTSGRGVILNGDMTFCGNASTIFGSFVHPASDTNRYTLTLHNVDADGNQDFYVALGSVGSLDGTFQLQGGDTFICDGGTGATDECFFQLDQTGSTTFNLYLDGKIGDEQVSGTVSNVGTTYTVSGITTTGYLVGDEIYWTTGKAATGRPYEITAVTGTSVSYITDLANSSSVQLRLTPDQGTVGGVPSSTHTTPTLTPVTGDQFRLVAPVKLGYSTANGGWWRIRGQATGATVIATSNIRMNGFSITNSTGDDSNAHMLFRFAQVHTGQRQLSFMNLGHHKHASPYSFSAQGMAMNYIYCHDSIPGSSSNGSCLDFQPCTAPACGVAYSLANLFIGHFEGTRTSGCALTVGGGDVTPNNDSIVIWHPTIHEGPNRSTAEICGIQCDDCDNSIIESPVIWNIADPDGTNSGQAIQLGLGTGSVLENGWIVNGGSGIYMDGWTVLNTYISNLNNIAYRCGNLATTGGAVYASVASAWGITPTQEAVRNCHVDGLLALGKSSGGSGYAWSINASRTVATNVRNVLVTKRTASGFYVDSAFNSNVTLTLEHLVCGSVAASTPNCLWDRSANAHTLVVKDVAADACADHNLAAWTVDSATPVTTLDRATRNSTTGTGCALAGANWDTKTNEASTADMQFTASASNNYNLGTTSPLFRTGGTPTNSSRAVRCAMLDISRLRTGLPFDATWTDIMTESCGDADKDAWLDFPLGTNSPDNCPRTTDLRNSVPCANDGGPEVCAIIPDLAAADDSYEFWQAPEAVTIRGVSCRCRGTCTPTIAQFSLEDRGGTAMTITGGTPTCATTGNATYAAVTAGNSLVKGEGLAFDVTNTPDPATDEYTLCVTYTTDRQ